MGDIDAHDQRRRRIRGERAHHGLVDPLAVDELRRAGTREDAAHAHANEIGILAMVLHPGGDLRLVGHANGARIDLLRAPTMGEAAAGEAFTEAAGGARRIAEHRPQQLGVGIGQRALDGVPHRIGDSRRFVEQGEGAAAFVVQAGDGLGVLLQLGNGVDPPGLVAAGLGRMERRRGVGEPRPIAAHGVPLGELGPGLCAELAFGVGADHAARIAQGRHRLQDDPGDQRRLADAVARGDGDPHRLALGRAEMAVEQAGADPDQDFPLP